MRPRLALALALSVAFAPGTADAGLLDRIVAPVRDLVTRARPPTTSVAGTPLVFILSDTHMSEGVRDDGKMSPLEDFVVDDEMAAFVTHALGRQRADKIARAKMVLAGDVFDFLKVVTPPTGEAWPTEGPMASADERGVAPDGPVAAMKMRRILQAHPKVVDALRTWAEAGNDLVLVAGNHDQEMFHPAVRRELRRALGPKAAKRVTFAPREHLDGDMLIEHGQRYDPMNSVSAMLWPFQGTARDRRLRPSAGNFMVVKVNNPLKLKAPRVNQVSRGAGMIKVALHDAPREVLRILPFAAEMSQRTGALAPTRADAQTVAIHERLAARPTAVAAAGRQINATRAARGQRPLDGAELHEAVRAWDDLAVRPYLETVEVRGGRLRGMVQMLRPREFRKWVDASLGNTGTRAQAYALEELVNVHVSGHSHDATIEEIASLGERGRDALRRRLGIPRARQGRFLVNAGTWTPVADVKGKADPRATLTYVEVTRKKGRTEPRLMRWDADRQTGVEHARPTRHR